jgi:hypothetical protein
MTKEIKELILFTVDLINGIDKTNEDKRLTWLDVFNFFPAMLTAPAAFRNIKGIEQELANFTPEGKEEINALFQSKLKVRNEVTQEVTQDILDILLQLVKTLNKLTQK